MTALDAVLEAARREAEALMIDRIDFYRPGPDVFDRESGTTVPGPRLVTFYTGKARVKVAQLADAQVQAGERELTLRQYRVSIPFSMVLPVAGERPQPGDLIDVTDAEELRMVGMRLWVKGVQYSSTATAWRIIAEDRS